METLISTAASASPPAICGSGGAGFAVLWNNAANTAIRGQMLLGDGKKTGAEFAVSTTAAGEGTLPAAVGDIGTPGFTVAWLDTAARVVRTRRFDGHGVGIGDETQVNTSDVDTGFRPAIARLSNRDSVVAWVGTLGVRARIFGPDGAPKGGEIEVNDAGGVHVGPVRVTGTDANSFVVAWRGGENLAVAHVTARVRVFTLDGTTVGGDHVPNFSGFTGDMGMTFLSTFPGQDSGFVIARAAAQGPGTERVAIMSPFSSGGVQQPEFNLTHAADHTVAQSFAASALPLGSFVVTWAERFTPDQGDSTGDNVKARMCAGLPGQLITVPVAGAGNQTSPAVATGVMFDGQIRVGFAWIDDSVSGSAATVRAVRSRVFTDSFAEPF